MRQLNSLKFIAVILVVFSFFAISGCELEDLLSKNESYLETELNYLKIEDHEISLALEQSGVLVDENYSELITSPTAYYGGSNLKPKIKLSLSGRAAKEGGSNIFLVSLVDIKTNIRYDFDFSDVIVTETEMRIKDFSSLSIYVRPEDYSSSSDLSGLNLNLVGQEIINSHIVSVEQNELVIDLDAYFENISSQLSEARIKSLVSQDQTSASLSEGLSGELLLGNTYYMQVGLGGMVTHDGIAGSNALMCFYLSDREEDKPEDADSNCQAAIDGNLYSNAPEALSIATQDLNSLVINEIEVFGSDYELYEHYEKNIFYAGSDLRPDIVLDLADAGSYQDATNDIIITLRDLNNETNLSIEVSHLLFSNGMPTSMHDSLLEIVFNATIPENEEYSHNNDIYPMRVQRNLDYTIALEFADGKIVIHMDEVFSMLEQEQGRLENIYTDYASVTVPQVPGELSTNTAYLVAVHSPYYGLIYQEQQAGIVERCVYFSENPLEEMQELIEKCPN